LFCIVLALGPFVLSTAKADEYNCGESYSISETTNEYIIACDTSGATNDCVSYEFIEALPTEQGTALKYCESPQTVDSGEEIQRCLYTLRGQVAGELNVDGETVMRGRLPCIRD
jgi:hypothetical protein